MPVEIRQLIIKTEVQSSNQQPSPSESFAQTQDGSSSEDMTKKIASKILEHLKSQKER